MSTTVTSSRSSIADPLGGGAAPASPVVRTATPAPVNGVESTVRPEHEVYDHWTARRIAHDTYYRKKQIEKEMSMFDAARRMSVMPDADIREKVSAVKRNVITKPCRSPRNTRT